MARQTVIVVAAVLVEQGRVLVTQRRAGSDLAGAWEFPGGKVEPDEDPRAALVRELREELGLSVEVGAILEVAFHRYPTKSVLLLFYRVVATADSPPPRALEVAALQWRSAEELRADEFPPADAGILSTVRRLLAEPA